MGNRPNMVGVKFEVEVIDNGYIVAFWVPAQWTKVYCKDIDGLHREIDRVLKQPSSKD